MVRYYTITSLATPLAQKITSHKLKGEGSEHRENHTYRPIYEDESHINV